MIVGSGPELALCFDKGRISWKAIQDLQCLKCCPFRSGFEEEIKEIICRRMVELKMQSVKLCMREIRTDSRIDWGIDVPTC